MRKSSFSICEGKCFAKALQDKNSLVSCGDLKKCCIICYVTVHGNIINILALDTVFISGKVKANLLKYTKIYIEIHSHKHCIYVQFSGTCTLRLNLYTDYDPNRLPC